MKGKNVMKKISYLLLSIMLLISAICLCACGGNDSEDSSKETTSSNEVASTTVKDKETQATTEDSGKVTYKVTVVDEAGNPISNAMVQCCKDACVPGVTNADGVAEFVLAEDAYDVKFISLPEGYTYSANQEVFNFEDGKTELTITLKAE